MHAYIYIDIYKEHTPLYYIICIGYIQCGCSSNKLLNKLNYVLSDYKCT